jgi:hypothetical protein
MTFQFCNANCYFQLVFRLLIYVSEHNIKRYSNNFKNI